MLPACGGVEITINPVKLNSDEIENTQYTSGALEETRELVLTSKPEPNTLVWEVIIPDSLEMSLNLRKLSR
jgi:hypothetical protein